MMKETLKREVLEKRLLQNAISNEEFVSLTKAILTAEANEPPYDNQSYLDFTRVNLRRYEGYAKKVELSSDIINAVNSSEENLQFILLNEPWCSDGSFSQPVIHKIAEASNGKIELKILLRDENEPVMNKFLTNGGKSIPKLVVLNEENEVLGTWGPRPKALQKQVIETIQNPSNTVEDKVKLTNRWYIKDKGKSLQEELLKILYSKEH